MGKWMEVSINLFNDFWKQRGVRLQSVSFKNDVTHRIVFYGDPSNWGTVEERQPGQWQNFLGQLYDLTSPKQQDNSGYNLSYLVEMAPMTIKLEKYGILK